jgi:Uma2 family endonuclease
MLTLPRSLTFTPSQFAQVCAANPEAVLELDADGTLIEMTPTGGASGARTKPSEPCSGWRSSRAAWR